MSDSRYNPFGKVAVCYVLSGTISRWTKARVLRHGSLLWEGEISSLKRFKGDADKVHVGKECGICLSGFQDLQPGDSIQAYAAR